MSWYKQGNEGAEAAKAYDDERAKLATVPRRFWLKPDTSKIVVFLDTAGFFFREHTLYRNGKWNTFITCLNDIPEIKEECPVDLLPDNAPSYVGAFTIIDIGTYKTKKGEDLINPKQLLMCKSMARGKIMKRKERLDGDLTYCKFELSRIGTKDVSTGSDFEYVERLTREQVLALVPPKTKDPEEYIKPVNYLEAFAPMTVPAINRLLTMSGGAPPNRETQTPFGAADTESATNESEAEKLKNLM